MKALLYKKVLSRLMASSTNATSIVSEASTYNGAILGSAFNGGETKVSVDGTLSVMIPPEEDVGTMLSFTFSEDVCKDGYSWVKRTKTLTITDLSISAAGNIRGIILPGGSTIVVQGNNNIFSKDYCIYSSGSLTIKGNGSLTVEGYRGIKVGYAHSRLKAFFNRA